MICMNETEVEYWPGITLADLVLAYYIDVAEADFEEYMVVVNGVAINSAQAEAAVVSDGDKVYIVPKVDGG